MGQGPSGLGTACICVSLEGLSTSTQRLPSAVVSHILIGGF